MSRRASTPACAALSMRHPLSLVPPVELYSVGWRFAAISAQRARARTARAAGSAPARPRVLNAFAQPVLEELQERAALGCSLQNSVNAGGRTPVCVALRRTCSGRCVDPRAAPSLARAGAPHPEPAVELRRAVSRRAVSYSCRTLSHNCRAPLPRRDREHGRTPAGARVRCLPRPPSDAPAAQPIPFVREHERRDAAIAREPADARVPARRSPHWRRSAACHPRRAPARARTSAR